MKNTDHDILIRLDTNFANFRVEFNKFMLDQREREKKKADRLKDLERWKWIMILIMVMSSSVQADWQTLIKLFIR